MAIFRMSLEQEKALEKWKEKIKELHGEYGHFDYTFSPFEGTTWIKVYSHLTKTALNLTDFE